MTRPAGRCPPPLPAGTVAGRLGPRVLGGDMRAWIIACVVLAYGAAGCAGDKATGPQPVAVAPNSLLAQAPTLSNEETVEFLNDAAVRKLAAICQAHRTTMIQMACVRESLLRGFDSTGEAAKNCGADITAPATVRCIISGTIGYEVALQADLDAARDYDWNDGRGGLRTAARQLSDKVLGDCRGSTTADLDACVLSGVANAFSLPESQVAVCTRPNDRAQSFDCLLRSFMIQRIGGAIEKMSVEDDEQI